MQFAQRRAQGDDRVADAISDRSQFCINASHVCEVLVGEPFAFGANQIVANIDSFEELGRIELR